MKPFANPIFLGSAIGIITIVFGLFHLLVLIGLVPDTVVWGGRITQRQKLIIMETVSLITIILVGAISFIHGRMISTGNGTMVLRIVVWGFAALFLLNTMGNIFAKTAFERFAFTPVTARLTFLTLRLALLKV